MQVALAIATAVALGVLFEAIRHGLLGTPEMQIAGNGSSASELHWYQDRSDGSLPAASVISVPLGVYRLAMLAWALWLALALLRWLRWGWDCFSSDARLALAASAASRRRLRHLEREAMAVINRSEWQRIRARGLPRFVALGALRNGVPMTIVVTFLLELFAGTTLTRERLEQPRVPAAHGSLPARLRPERRPLVVRALAFARGALRRGRRPDG